MIAAFWIAFGASFFFSIACWAWAEFTTPSGSNYMVEWFLVGAAGLSYIAVFVLGLSVFSGWIG